MLRDKVRFPLWALSGAWLLLASLSIWNCTRDDSYICYRYAQNLVHGFGLVLNRGERVEGYTDFLWVLLLAGASKITSDPILSSKLLGVLFNILGLVACYYLARMISTPETPVYGIALAATATSAYFVADGVEGLEGPLFVALLCWLAVAYLKARRASDGRQHLWLAAASVLSALLLMTRPDAATAYALLWLHAAWTFRARLRNLLAFSLPLILLYGPYFLWRWHYYGLFFPNTFYAKGGGTLALYQQGAAAVAAFLITQAPGLLIAALVGFYIVLFPRVETTVLGLLVFSRLLFEVWSGGVSAGSDRFIVPALPLIWLLTEVLLMKWLGQGRLGLRGAYWMVAVTVVLLCAQVAQFVRYRHDHLEPEEAAWERAHGAAGKWLKANADPNASVAIGDIGAIGYWSELRIIDLDGLADTTISHSPGVFLEKGTARYVLSRSPGYVILRVRRCDPQAPDDVVMPLDRKVFVDPNFRSGFERLTCWDFFPDYHLLLFKRAAKESF